MSVDDGLTLEQRALGAYLGLAVGDALGATVEFMTPGEIEAEYKVHKNIRGGGWLNLKVGQVTDDTTMSLALGDSLITCQSIDAMHIAQFFSDWMRDKPVDIGNTVRRGIMSFRRTGVPVSLLSEHDAGNGACMRCLPIAIFSYQLAIDFKEANRAQAHVTHNTPVSDAACECVIAMIHASFAGTSLALQRDMAEKSLLAKFPMFTYDKGRVVNPSGYIVETMGAVFQSLFNMNSFEDSMIDVVNRGGDADTTGAILGMLAGAYYGIDSIPKRWVKKLDKSIRKACEYQALALLKPI